MYPCLPVGWLLQHPFDTIGQAPNVKAPSLVLHGLDDQIIPATHGRALAEALTLTTHLEIAGAGHNDSLLWPDTPAHEAYLSFLEAVAPGRPPDPLSP